MSEQIKVAGKIAEVVAMFRNKNIPYNDQLSRIYIHTRWPLLPDVMRESVFNWVKAELNN